jgi:hypothetical protein
MSIASAHSLLPSTFEKRMKKESLSLNLIDTIANARTLEISSEVVEFAVDQTLESGVLKDIPLVGWMAKLASIKTSISDQLFLSKILRFLQHLESLGDKKNEEFSKQIKGDEKYARKVGEKIISALDRIDDPEKSDILAACFDHFLTGHIDFEEFSEISHVIDRSMLSDLRSISQKRKQGLDYDRLVSTGLATFGIEPNFTDEEAPTIGYKLSNVAKKVSRIMRSEHREHVDEIRARGPLRHFFKDPPIDPFKPMSSNKSE